MGDKDVITPPTDTLGDLEINYLADIDDVFE